MNGFLGSGANPVIMFLFVMLPGMLAIYLILKYEKKTVIPFWILAVFMIPVLGYLSYLFKYFFMDKRRGF